MCLGKTKKVVGFDSHVGCSLSALPERGQNVQYTL